VLGLRHERIDDRAEHAGDVSAVGGFAMHDLQDVEAYEDVGQELEPNSELRGEARPSDVPAWSTSSRLSFQYVIDINKILK
jgi:hypothetical protein